MAEREFNLLNQLQKAKGKSTIDELRAQARGLIKTNKELVEQIWSINLKLAQIKPGQEAADLQKRREALVEQVKDYPTMIEQITQQIHDMEVEINGTSNVGGSSPYKL
jgi:uncharacterized coiled-coil DUF342 family protein